VTRLFVDMALQTGMTVELPSERAHYLFRVLRLAPGAELRIFCGDGVEYQAIAVDTDPRRGRLAIRDAIRQESSAAFRLHLIQAVIKGDKLDFAVQKATELGVTDIWLTTTDRSEVRPRDERRERRLQHWRRIVVAACEQCGRARLPRLHGPDPLPATLAAAGVQNLLMLEPGAPPLADAPAADTAIMIGPEGGFTDDERTMAVAAGATLMGLGDYVLRADTAPVAALAVLRQRWAWRLP
jgi:16S rRNA (uracil1498-N3)-methyltransferase